MGWIAETIKNPSIPKDIHAHSSRLRRKLLFTFHLSDLGNRHYSLCNSGGARPVGWRWNFLVRYCWRESTRTSFLPPLPSWSSQRHPSWPSSQRWWTFWMPHVMSSAASATQIQEAGRCIRRRTSPLIGEGIISINHCWRMTDGGGRGRFVSLARWRVGFIVGAGSKARGARFRHGGGRGSQPSRAVTPRADYQ